jgi:hypothetical protein
MQTKYFGTFVLANLEGFMMVDSSKSVTYMKSHEIFQKLVITIQNMRCPLFLIGRVAYPVCTYLQKK